MRTLSRRCLAVPAVVAALALVAAGCSSDDDESNSGAVDTSVLGEENRATGDPLAITLQTTGGQAVAFTNEVPAAQAAVSYVNEYLGGINGRPIELTVCEDQIQASLARECANKAIASDSVAVVAGDPSNPDAVTAVTSPAGMPFVVNAGTGQQTLTMPNTYVLGNALSGVVGIPANYAKENGLKKVAVLAIDAPVATGAVKQLGPLVFGNAGAAMDLVTVPPGTADMTAQVQAADKAGNEMFHILGDAGFCMNAIKALRTLNIDKPISTVTQCLGTEENAKQVPGGYEDIIVSMTSAQNPDDEETKIFRAVLDKYGASDAADGVSAYRAILSLQRALNGMPGEVTRESVVERLNAMPEPLPLPMYAGGTFQCGTTPVPPAPNTCTGAAVMGTSDADGNVGDVQQVDLSPLFAMPTRS